MNKELKERKFPDLSTKKVTVSQYNDFVAFLPCFGLKSLARDYWFCEIDIHFASKVRIIFNIGNSHFAQGSRWMFVYVLFYLDHRL